MDQKQNMTFIAHLSGQTHRATCLCLGLSWCLVQFKGTPKPSYATVFELLHHTLPLCLLV